LYRMRIFAPCDFLRDERCLISKRAQANRK
jgi:hypothetical protein